MECLLKKKGEFLKLDTPVFAVEEAAERANGGNVGAEPVQLAVLEEIEIASHLGGRGGSGGKLPGQEVILRGTGEARLAVFLLERPDINQNASARFANTNETLNGFELLVFGREVLDNGDAEHAIKSIGTRERERRKEKNTPWRDYKYRFGLNSTDSTRDICVVEASHRCYLDRESRFAAPAPLSACGYKCICSLRSRYREESRCGTTE